MIPKDPYMLLSYINTQLRDNYKDLSVLCDELNIDRGELVSSLKSIDYSYDSDINQFI